MPKKVEKIIIIDDEKRMCDSLSALLSQSSYQVATFQDPLKAMKHIESADVDLVVTDIKMPKMTGLEILEKIHEKDELLPVILMTAYATLSSAVEAISKGIFNISSCFFFRRRQNAGRNFIADANGQDFLTFGNLKQEENPVHFNSNQPDYCRCDGFLCFFSRCNNCRAESVAWFCRTARDPANNRTGIT